MAKSAAYIAQARPEILSDQAEMDKVATMLQIDEFHVFDPSGTLYTGTQPKYYGFTFLSGEQMQFFYPMLNDKTLELCQEITPNTAEGKLMQYAAVWMENGENIVQVGLEPARVLEATSRNELSYIFSLLTADSGAILYAIDPMTFEILGSTESELEGKTLKDINLDTRLIRLDGKGFRSNINNASSYCVFTNSDSSPLLLGRSCTTRTLYNKVNQNTFLLGMYLILIASIMIYSISRYLDRKIITSIRVVNRNLNKIIKGDLDKRVDVRATPEFSELSDYINKMVKSLLDTTDKLSYALDLAEIPIGVYEYSQGMDRVRYTKRLPQILGLSKSETKQLMADKALFIKRLDEIHTRPFDADEGIYQLDEHNMRYVKIEHMANGPSALGILLDITGTVLEKKRIEQERDEDILTGLLTRRAFYAQMDGLFAAPEQLQHAAMLMIDTDNLKEINDNFGHAAGDQYLRSVAQVLRDHSAPNKLVARLSGDEFAVLIYNCTEPELQGYITELEQMQNTQTVAIDNGRNVLVAFSLGCALYPHEGSNYHTLLKIADAKMYEQKRVRKKE